jgi:hypothetical protein
MIPALRDRIWAGQFSGQPLDGEVTQSFALEGHLMPLARNKTETRARIQLKAGYRNLLNENHSLFQPVRPD